MATLDAEIRDLCHGCPRRGDCLIADSESAPERCTYHRQTAEAEAAYKLMVASRIDRAMLNRVITLVALESHLSPREVRERLRAGGIATGRPAP